MKASSIFDWLIDVLAYFACILIVLAMASVCFEVVMRYSLNRPQIWVLEFTEYILLFSTFLGTAWLLKREGHVKIDIVTSRLNLENRALLGTITSAVGAISCLAVAWYSAEATVDFFRAGIMLERMVPVPQWVILAIIPVGFSLLFMQFLRQAYGSLVARRSLQNKEPKG